jgi:hypothetical protein
LQTLFQYDQKSDSGSNGEDRKIDVPYRIWIVVGFITVMLARWNANHYELFAKIAWTVMGPGFTFSQTWNKSHDLLSRSAFGALLLVHFCLMQVLYPYLPIGHYGYILLIGIAEIMTIGLAYQVWVHLRSQKSRPSSE